MKINFYTFVKIILIILIYKLTIINLNKLNISVYRFIIINLNKLNIYTLIINVYKLIMSIYKLDIIFLNKIDDYIYFIIKIFVCILYFLLDQFYFQLKYHLYLIYLKIFNYNKLNINFLKKKDEIIQIKMQLFLWKLSIILNIIVINLIFILLSNIINKN